jgi:hypothetical protein
MGSRYETVATAEVCPAGTARSPVRTCPLWVQVLSQEVHPTVVVGVPVGEGVFAAGLSGAGGPVGQFRRAEGRLGLVFDVPRVHAASGDPHVAEGGPGDDPAAVPEAFPTGGDGLFPTPGQPLLHEAHGASSASEAVPDVVDGRGGPAPGHLCPGGSGWPREPVSVASAVGPGDGASWSRPASVGLCRLRFRADSSMASGGAGYREHHPGHGVPSRTGPDPLPASSAPLFPPPEIRSTVDRRDGRFGPPAEIWRGPDDPPEAGSPAGFGLQPSAGRCGSGDFLRLWVHRLFPVGRRHPHSPEVFDGATLTDLDHAKFHPLERSRGDGCPEPLRSKAGS